MKKNIYCAIDLKSFYASVECVERGLDPLTVNLVVADGSRTDKTICLAVSPSLKSYGVPSRPRLFEVKAKVREANNMRRWRSPSRKFIGATFDDLILRADPSYEIDYVVAPPRMALYIEYSRKIYSIYLRYFAPEDIHVYSVDEVFIDLTAYLTLYKLSAKDLCRKVIREVLSETGITATVGIGTNLYLAKVAMDIVAKKMKPDKTGARLAELDEETFRKTLWEHKPLTDFWRIGRGYERRLAANGMFTLGDVALMSEKNEELLYKLFGVNAELLIDHAWGFEPCTIADIKSYRPLSSSLSTGQVLSCPYEYGTARLIVREMCDLLVLDMVEKSVCTNLVTLTVGYEAIGDGDEDFLGETGTDFYGRRVPKHAHGSRALGEYTSSTERIMSAVLDIFDSEVDKNLSVRRVAITVCNLKDEGERTEPIGGQISFFSEQKEELKREEKYQKEKRRQRAENDIKRRFGKNAILRGMNFEDGATTIERNLQIGGHKA